MAVAAWKLLKMAAARKTSWSIHVRTGGGDGVRPEGAFLLGEPGPSLEGRGRDPDPGRVATAPVGPVASHARARPPAQGG